MKLVHLLPAQYLPGVLQHGFADHPFHIGNSDHTGETKHIAGVLCTYTPASAIWDTVYQSREGLACVSIDVTRELVKPYEYMEDRGDVLWRYWIIPAVTATQRVELPSAAGLPNAG